MMTSTLLLVSSLAFGIPGQGLDAPVDRAGPIELMQDPTPEVTPTPGETPTPEPQESARCRMFYPDCDMDGYGDEAGAIYACKHPNLAIDQPACMYRSRARDCDDTDPLVSPAGVEGIDFPETTQDGIDNDCDGFVDVDCDGTTGLGSPRITLLGPERGAFTDAPTVRVSGQVVPAQSRTTLEPVVVNGVIAEMSLCSQDGGAFFDAEVPLEPGLTTLTVRAQDFDGRFDEAITSVAYGENYINLSTDPIRGSLVSLLNQGSWDILGDFSEGELDPDDLEDELMAANPIINDSGSDDCIDDWEVYGNATRYTHEDLQVDFTVTGGVVKVNARLVRPQIWAEGYVYYDLDWYCGGWDDRVDVDAYASFSEVVATANGRLSLQPDGRITVRFTEVVANANGADIDVDADNVLYDWLIDIFEDDLEDEMEDFVEDELYDYVSNDLGPELEGELNELDLSYTVDVSGIDYDVDFTYDSLSIPNGSVVLGFAMGVGYDVDPRVPLNLGMVSFPTDYVPDYGSTFGLEVGLDFFNGSLHGLWEGGSLHLSETLSTDPLIMGSANPLLPPIITPGFDSYLMELSLGDVIASIEVPLEDGTVYTFDAALSSAVPMGMTAISEGQSIYFNIDFGPSTVQYDLLGADLIPPELLDASEAAMAVLFDEILLELEGYLEELEISYLGVPMVIDELRVSGDSLNPAMISVDGDARYTGQ